MTVERSPLASGRARLTGDVSYDTGTPRREAVWFDVPVQTADGLSRSGSPWLAGLLPVAATLGEPLRLCAPVDPALLEGATRVLGIWRSWYRRLRDVAIEAEVAPAPVAPSRTGAFFSGGVDSFFTVVDLDESGDGVEDLITVWGFDVPLRDAAAFGRMRESLGRAAHDMGKGLLDVATNLRETRFRACSWGALGHGPALAAVALALEGRFASVRVASTHGHHHTAPYGSHPRTDPLLSTTRTRILHHGAERRRAQKTARIAGFAPAQKALRVCWKSLSDGNCGRCAKCYCTMLHLHVLGRLEDFATFDRSVFRVADAARIRSREWGARSNLEDIREEARTRGLGDVVEAIDEGIRRSDRTWFGWPRRPL